jgi:hypothetical protein
MKFKFVDTHKTEHRVDTLCQMFGVTSSGYYQWRNRGKSNRELENEILLEKIQITYKNNRCVYGSPRLKQTVYLLFSTPGSKTDERERPDSTDPEEI